MLKRKSVNTVAIVLLLALAGLNFVITVPYSTYAAVLFIWLSLTVLGSFFVQWNYHLKSYHSNKAINENWVSITFDDGPNREITPKILEILKKNGAKATFFCVGKYMEKYPDLTNRIIEEGHTLGNHTYSHPEAFGFFGTSKVVEELRKTKSLIKELTDSDTNLYRPAFGVTNPNIEKAVKQLELKPIGWNVRSLDTTSRPVKTVLRRITSKVSKGDIILLHDTSEKTIKVLERLLVFLQEKNLRSVTVEQLLDIDSHA
ncbi:polysaccharide deacetylase family protein [Maribacter algicola]|uniref:Polysaccharide deacetylase family protein n=1 Tax=Meishania litoralis TaxID=3434685 RepID=A0ACC7LGH9_9FLAO